jgi:hypothetical protein
MNLLALNGFELLDSMHLLALAGAVVPNPGVAFSFSYPRLAKMTFPFSEPYYQDFDGAPQN